MGVRGGGGGDVERSRETLILPLNRTPVMWYCIDSKGLRVIICFNIQMNVCIIFCFIIHYTILNNTLFLDESTEHIYQNVSCNMCLDL